MKNKFIAINFSLFISILSSLVLNTACTNYSAKASSHSEIRASSNEKVHPTITEEVNSLKVAEGDSVVAQSSTKAEADRFREEGQKQYNSRQFVQAAENLERAMNIYREIGDRESYQEVLQEVLAIYYFTGGGKDKIAALVAERDRLEDGGELAASSGSQETEAEAEAKDSTELNSEVEELISSGILAVQNEDFAGGRTYFQQALSKAKEINGELEQIAVQTEIGKSYLYEGDYDNAIASFQLAEDLSSERYPEIENGFGAYDNLQSNGFIDVYREIIIYQIPFWQLFGEAYLQSDRPAEALTYFEKALTVKNQLDSVFDRGQVASLSPANFIDPITTTDPNLLLSRANYSLGNYQQALDYAQKAIAKAENVKNEVPQWYNAPNLGVRTGEAGDGQGYALAGIALEKLGQLEQAEQNLRIAVQIFEATRNKSTFKADINHSLKLFNNQVRAASWLQRVLYAQNKTEEALAAAEWGRGRLLVEAATATNLRNASLEEKVNAVVDAQYGSRDICQELKANPPNFNPPPQVDKPVVQAPETSISQAARPETDSSSSNSTEEIMKNVFPLQYYQQQQIANCDNEARIAEIKQETLENARQNPEEFETAFSKYRKVNTSVGTPSNIEPPNIEQLKQVAQSQQATIVEYSFISDSTYFHGSRQDFASRNVFPGEKQTLLIWVIKPTGEIQSRQIDLQAKNIDIEQLVDNTRQTMGLGRSFGLSLKPGAEPTTNQPRNPTSVQASEQLKQLHQLLIEPIADLLPTSPEEQVIFVPHEELFLVPFVALTDPNDKYLIEKHTITTSPSIQALALTSQKQQQITNNQKALVVGNPTMSSIPQPNNQSPQQLANLPGAEAEGKEIAQLLNTQLLTGDIATKDRVLEELPNAQYIHLATHGLLDDYAGFGIPGTIALAPSTQDNGFLSASVIQELDLSAELAVLSACDTGRGDISGDGVVGLSRSFIIAGVPSIVVSLWAVPDAPTADLMVEFYRNFTTKGLNKSQALRQAMLTVKQQTPDPINWAAFTLIGEGK
jgi:CHAT domain-containing protein/tetratricopeptide (TPR) repeat protein